MEFKSDRLLGQSYALWNGAIGGLALAVFILLYNVHHKSNPLSPLLMGICRILVYVTAALCVAPTLPLSIYKSAMVLLCYLIGLTYAAKKEHLNHLEHIWPLGLLTIPLIYGLTLSFVVPLALIPLTLLAVWVGLSVKRLLRKNQGDVAKAVIALIAGISLLDATLLAGQGDIGLMCLAIVGFLLTLLLQRWVSGT